MFRELERAAAARALREQAEVGGVLALGSGAVLDAACIALLDGLPVVYLATDFGTIARRLGLDRPRIVLPGNPRGRLRAMLEERRPLYERLATVTVQTDDEDPEELADRDRRRSSATAMTATRIESASAASSRTRWSSGSACSASCPP